jgi:hypothetical protein
MARERRKLAGLFLILSCALFLVLGWSLRGRFPHGDLLFARGAVLCVGLHLGALGLLGRRQLRARIIDYFTSPGPAVNLAVFRVVLFATLFSVADHSLVVRFARLPPDLLFPPAGLASIAPHIPINESLATVASLVFRVSCACAAVGLATRTAAWLAVVSGLYVLGLPQLFGKVNHYHHLLWFAAVLAASPCADALSIDALRDAWRRGKGRGSLGPPPPSVQYALPLRFVLLLMGIIYFFPGFWKWWDGGLGWVAPGNLKYQLYHKWYELGGWTPAFRIDHHPWLLALAAAGTIVFEMGFIFLLFSRRGRVVAALSGLGFHNMTWLFMRISFLSLQKCYVAFVNWDGLFRRVGRWLFPAEMVLSYRAEDVPSRQVVAVLQALDLFQRVKYVAATSAGGTVPPWGGSPFSSSMRAATGGATREGFAALRLVARRVPLFYGLLPFVYARAVWPARGGAGSSPALPGEADDAPAPGDVAVPPPPRVRACAVVGGLLLLASAACGITALVHAWPVACYPTFAYIAGPERSELVLYTVDSDGTSRFPEAPVRDALTSARYAALKYRVLGSESPDLMSARLHAFWAVCEQHTPGIGPVQTVLFYEEKLVLRGPDSAEPSSRRLLAEIDVRREE